jgi:hypothetical protein
MEVQALQNRPDLALSPELGLLLNHYSALCRSRPQSMSSIPPGLLLSEIEAFHRVYQVGEYMELPEFSEWMIFLDNILIDHYAAKAEQDKKKR